MQRAVVNNYNGAKYIKLRTNKICLLSKLTVYTTKAINIEESKVKLFSTNHQKAKINFYMQW